jgi:hypothetical protein
MFAPWAVTRLASDVLESRRAHRHRISARLGEASDMALYAPRMVIAVRSIHRCKSRGMLSAHPLLLLGGMTWKAAKRSYEPGATAKATNSR